MQENESLPNKVYFLADAHLGADRETEKATVPALLAFLDRVAREKAALFILGDLYDFWFEFRHSIPRIYPSVLAKLYSLRDHGCSIGFTGGNHDCWMTAFLARELGATVSSGWLEAELQGKRVCMAHGDGLASGDNGYKLLKKILRSRVNIALYRLLPPDIAVPFALACSRLGRKAAPSKMTRIAEKLFQEVALPRFDQGFDYVILGHVHLPYQREHEDKKFYIVGDWIESLSYLVMENGEVNPKLWRPGRVA